MNYFKNRLANHATYLIGPMEKVVDNGAGWRKELSDFCHGHDIGVFNPVDKPFLDYPQEDKEFYDMLKLCRADGDFDKLSHFCKNIVRSDLHMVDLSNFCIAYVDTDVHMMGSYTEITYAALEKKPVIVCCQQGKAALPGFMWGLGLSHEMFFSSWDEVKAYILEVCYAPIEQVVSSHKWRFIDYDKVFNRSMAGNSGLEKV